MLDMEPIKARLAAATTGALRVRRQSHGSEVVADDGLAIAWCGNNGTYSTSGSRTRDEVGSFADATLIAHTPADLAALIAEVESQRDAISVACEETRQLREDVDRLRAAIATHRQEQGEAVTKSAADAADRRLWKFLAAATQAGV